jgi:lysophospholipase
MTINTPPPAKRWYNESELHAHHSAVQTWFATHVSQGQMTSAGKSNKKAKLAYAYYIPATAKQAIVLSAGRVESYLKYQALFCELAHAGYAVFSCDHRGQGLSQRLTKNPMQGHIEDFADYAADLLNFVKQVVTPHFAKPWLLAHSMGGAIGLLAAQQAPAAFAKIALSAPMLGLVAPLPAWLTKLVLSLGLLGSNIVQAPLYFMGQKDYHPEAFGQNKLTHSELRYRIFREQQQAYPDTQLGGVTYHWVASALQALYGIERYACDIQIPVLCLSAGADEVVDNTAQACIMRRLPHGHFTTIEQARHELLFESDSWREAALNQILTFFEER